MLRRPPAKCFCNVHVLQDVYAEGGGLPPVFWDTLRLLSLKALTTPGLFRSQPVGRSYGISGGGHDCSPSNNFCCSLGGSSGGSSCSSGSDAGGSDASGSDGSPAAADEADGANSGRKVLLCKRLYDSGQDALKVLPSTTKDLHAVRQMKLLQVPCIAAVLAGPRLPHMKIAGACLAEPSPDADRRLRCMVLKAAI